MPDYQKAVKEYLSAYKANKLGITDSGTWRGAQYAHILPAPDYKMNILEPYRDGFWEYFEGLKPRIKLHQDFSHLNSSQAMCFNLFFPYVVDDLRHIRSLADALDLEQESAHDARFEHVPDRNEKTNFDFWVHLGSGRQILCELKLSESEFGSAKNDEKHHQKFHNVYQKGAKLEERFEPEYCDESTFLRHYQIMRNIWHLNLGNRDSVFFIFPRQNSELEEQSTFIRRCTRVAYRQQVTVMHLEDLVTKLEGSVPPGHDRLRQHLKLFTEKYLGLETSQAKT